MKVKVTNPIKVYHAPKHQEGIDLNGMEGTVVKDVTQYKGKVLSANFPVEVEFILSAEPGVKPVKFKVHLVSSSGVLASAPIACAYSPPPLIAGRG
jgi:hypothetical protein